MVLVTTLPVAETTSVHEMNGKGCGRKRQQPNFRYYPDICQKGLRKKTRKNIHPKVSHPAQTRTPNRLNASQKYYGINQLARSTLQRNGSSANQRIMICYCRCRVTHFSSKLTLAQASQWVSSLQIFRHTFLTATTQYFSKGDPRTTGSTGNVAWRYVNKLRIFSQ